MVDMSRTKTFLQNSITTAVYQAIVMISGFIVPRIMLVYYGSEINGLISSINQFITYFNLVEAGLSGATVYSLYKPLAENDHKGISAIVVAAKNFYIKSGYFFVGLVLALSLIYPLFIHLDELSPISISILIIALGAKGFLEFLTLAKYRTLLTAAQKTYVISIASSVYVVLNTIIIFVLSMLKCNILMVYILAIVALYARSLILIIYARKNFSYIDYNEEPNNSALDKRWDALFLQVLQSVHVGAPTVLATILTNLKMVSVYSVFNMVMVGINGILSIFVSGLSATFGDIIVRNEVDTLQKSYREFECVYYMIITFVYSVTMIMLQPFVSVYTTGVKDANYYQPLIAFLFVLNGFLHNLKTPQGMLVISAGHYKETKWQTITQALIAIVFGFIFGKYLGLVGILVGMCLSNLYRDIDLMFYIPKNVTHLSYKSTLIRIIRKIVDFMIIVFPFYYIKLDISNYLNWVFYAVLTSVYALAVILVEGLIFERNSIKSIFNRLLSMVKRQKNVN